MSRECPNGGGGGGGGGNRGCFNCGEEGHNKIDCPNPPKERLGEDGKPLPPLYTPVHLAEEELFDDGCGSGINFNKYDAIPVQVSGDGSIPARLETFDDAGLRPILMSNIQKSNYTVPTPIQRYCIPTAMIGRDIMGCAQTGSGKTAAFLLPILNKLLETGDLGSGGLAECAEPGAVIMAPTRELAIQIHNEARKFATGSVLNVVVVYGGTTSRSQINQLERGCSVLVATPGRLIDFVNKGKISFANVKFFVLDEADRMLDMGFLNDIERVMTHHTMPGLTERQTFMFSATFPEEIQTLAGKYQNNYVFFVVGVVGAANADVVQEVMEVEGRAKNKVLVDKLSELSVEPKNKIIVFVEKKRTADFLASFLSSKDMSSTSIHGDRYQAQREEALKDFKKGNRSILIATAVAARGLDIKGVTHVINFDLPKEVDEYVHRIGRTGRVGNTGHAISFYDGEADYALAKDLVKILKDASQDIPNWLEEAAAGGVQTYFGTGDFAATDVRGQTNGVSAFGGPQDDEEW